MNDPNKKIEIDKSSLLSLKAELLRKQEEVSRAKTSTSIDDFVPKRVPKAPESQSQSSKSSKSKPSKHSKSSGDNSKAGQTVELEDSAELDRSKKILMAKSKYYDRMMASGGSLNSDDNCLVMFNQKKQTDRPASYSRYSSSEESASSSDEEGNDRNGPKNRLPERDDDLVEYTDYLGRSRKCLRKDLAEMLRQDREMEREARASRGEEPRLEQTATLRDDNSGDDDDEDLIGPPPPPPPSMAITEDTIGERFREMREQWARQEAANLEKDSVHYSDVLFDEARQHGVGYYAFSTDRDERNRQQLELDSIREATVDAQREKEDLRKARDRIIADRVRAAKARQRARLGLPPEEEKSGDKPDDGSKEELYDTEEERKRAKAEAKAKKKKEKEERRRDRERQKHVRPWDEGKEQDTDREWKPTKEWRVMSQEEWNEMQRKERNAEFAPPVDYGSRWEKRTERNPLLATATVMAQNKDDDDDDEKDSDEEEQIGPLPPSSSLGYGNHDAGMDNNPLLMPPPTTSGGGEPEEISMPSVPGMEDIFLPPEEEPPSRSLFFTTKKKKEFKRRNYETTAATGVPQKRANLEQRGVPIRNELSDDGEEEEDQRKARGGVEIAPPPTFDYYGPTSAAAGGGHKVRKPPVSKTSLEASIEAGLKFLRNQSDKAGPSGGTKNRWTSNADY